MYVYTHVNVDAGDEDYICEEIYLLIPYQNR